MVRASSRLCGTLLWPALCLVLVLIAAGGANASELTPLQRLGKKIFFDRNLSEPPGISCSRCHNPKAAFADPNSDVPVSEGSIPSRYGVRNAPSICYAAYSPAFHFDPTVRPGIMSGMYIGGFFWDGRAASLEDQAEAPFFDPLEMNNTQKADIIAKMEGSDYAGLFRSVFGEGSFDKPAKAFTYATMAIAEYERSSEVSPFTSKYDHYLAGQAMLTVPEQRGLALFSNTTMMGAKCVNCHSMSTDNPSGRPLFTNFGYQNLGVPANPENPYYKLKTKFNPAGEYYTDLGLGTGQMMSCYSEIGKFKIPSLRNVALTSPYEHNGVFKTLTEVVHFNNTRDMYPTCDEYGTPGVNCWPAAEVPVNVHKHMPPMPGTFGQLGLTDQQVDDIVAFLHTLSDGYTPE